MTSAVALLALLLTPQNDKAQANAYDDAWEAAWVAHSQSIYRTASKTAGMVLHIGDSITYANQYRQWPLNVVGKTAEDTAILTWCRANQALPGTPTATDTNGFYLCTVDVVAPLRSMTASGGIDTAEYLSGSGNGGTAMPSTTTTATAQGYVVSTTYTNNLHITSVAAAFAAAQFAVVMLGTNDVGSSRPVVDFTNDLTSIVNVLEGRNIVVIVSSIPPRVGIDVTPYNTAIRSFAQTRGLPLIDYYAEILARQPGTAWQGTLIQGDGVHPTYAFTGADPYNGPVGNSATHKTGSNAAADGYLLRSWLTVQKLKEVKSLVVDGTPVVTPPPPAPVAGSVDDDDNDSGCGCGSVAGPAFPGWLGAGAALLLLGAFRRRR